MTGQLERVFTEERDPAARRLQPDDDLVEAGLDTDATSKTELPVRCEFVAAASIWYRICSEPGVGSATVMLASVPTRPAAAPAAVPRRLVSRAVPGSCSAAPGAVVTVPPCRHPRRAAVTAPSRRRARRAVTAVLP